MTSSAVSLVPVALTVSSPVIVTPSMVALPLESIMLWNVKYPSVTVTVLPCRSVSSVVTLIIEPPLPPLRLRFSTLIFFLANALVS